MEGFEFVEKAVPMFNSLTYNDQRIYLKKFLKEIIFKRLEVIETGSPEYKEGYKDGYNEAIEDASCEIEGLKK